MSQFGVVPVTLPWEDIEVAVQTGELDGIAWSVVSVWKYLGSNGRCGRYEVLADSPQVFRSSDLASLAVFWSGLTLFAIAVTF